MNTICVDQGASSTRYVVNEGEVYVNPNNMVFVEEGVDTYLVPNSADIFDNFDVTINKIEGESTYFPVRALIGTLAERYKPANLRPSMNSNKSRQRVNYVSIITAVAAGILNTNIEPDVAVIIDFPPLEANKMTADYIRKELIGKFKVKFNTSAFNKEVVFNISDARIVSESEQASVSFFFNRNGAPRVETAKYNRGYVLSCDIGASTSDFVLIKDRRFQERTGQTYKIGGNVIKEIIKNKVRALYGSELTDEDAEVVITEGRLPYGSKYKDMSKELIDAKKEFAEMLAQNIDSYFGTVGVPLMSIKAIFVSGGGSMKSSYFDIDNNTEVVTSEPVSTYLTEVLRNICDGIDVVGYPDENPRMANIIGTMLSTKALRMA